MYANESHGLGRPLPEKGSWKRYAFVVAVLLLMISSSPPLIQTNIPVAAGSEAAAKYTVEITDAGAAKHEVWVRAVLSLSGATDLSVSPEGDNGDRWITIEVCYDARGTVPVERVDNRTWRVSPSSAGAVTVEYRASVNMPNRMTEGTYLAYLSSECGLVSAKSILLAPSPPVTAAVNFVLPQGWTVITDERWTRLNATSFSVSTGDLDLFAPGRWDVYTDTFGDGQMLRVAICGDTKHPKDDYIKNIKACLDYFHERVGRLPQRELNVVLADLPLPMDYMSGTPRLAVNQAGRDWGMFEGMLWHYWFLRTIRYDTQLDTDRAWWFGEGVSPFLLYPVYEEIGAASEVNNFGGFKYSNLTWKNWYAEYESHIGTKYDLPLVGYPAKGREGDPQYNQMIGYFKSSLVLELLNASMVEVTHGEYDVRDVVKNLYEDYALKGVGYRVEDILSAFNAISGNDYTEFFNAYVYGDEHLPILEEGDDYLFDWATLGDKAYRSMPNAEKVRPWTQATVPASETATLLEMRKESRHFTVYFHQQDAKMAVLLLLDCEKAYDAVAKLYGDEAKLKIRMFMTYNGTEYAVLGGHPEMIYGEKDSAGGVAVEAGDEIGWLRPIFNRNTTQMYDVAGPIHELGHAMLRQIYPGVYKNWEQWFNEGMPLARMAWLDKRWVPASENYSPFIDHEPLRQLQRSLLGVSHSIVPLTQLAKMNYAQFNDTGRLLSQGEGIAFHFYINSRYDDGLQRLLTKYNEGVPLSVAAERAFGITYANIENDLWATAGKAALNLDYTEFALSKMRREGVDTSLAQKLLPEEPFLALLVAYAAEARAGAGFERVVFGTITPDAPVKMDLGTTPLTSLNVSSAQRLDNFVVTVEEVMPAEVPTAAQGEVYCYVRVNSSSEGAGPITIVFKVESSWFSEHEANVSSTSMARHTANGWTLLPTEKIGQDGAYTYFSAVSPGMSVFAITAARNVSKVVPSTTIDGWVSPAAFGTPTTLFLVVDGLHPTVQNSGNDEPFIVVKLVDSKGSVLVEKGYNGKGLTGYGDYNPDKSLAPGSYRMEFWNGNVLVKIIPIIFSTDIISPTISSFTPTNGSVITSKTVSITASFSDDKGIKTSSVMLRVDGNDVTSSAVITTTTISYEGALGDGAHTAQLTVSDAASNTVSSTVSFTVSLQQQPQPPSDATTPATGSRCVVATATYGSELAPQVQYLRRFRDDLVMGTFAGRSFMAVFNAWYYSWSPLVAASIARDEFAKAVMRVVLQPLLNILELAATTFLLFSFNGELGMVISGLVASSLIGLVYVAPPAILAAVVVQRRRGSLLPIRKVGFLAIPWAVSMALLAIGEAFSLPTVLMAATASLVLLTAGIVVVVVSLCVARLFSHFPRRIERSGA